MRVAIYARISGAARNGEEVSSDSKGQDPGMQTGEMKEYTQRRGWTDVGEYIEFLLKQMAAIGQRESRSERGDGSVHAIAADASFSFLVASVPPACTASVTQWARWSSSSSRATDWMALVTAEIC